MQALSTSTPGGERSSSDLGGQEEQYSEMVQNITRCCIEKLRTYRAVGTDERRIEQRPLRAERRVISLKSSVPMH